MNDRGTQHGIFLVRATVGFCFVMHGLQKLFHPSMGGHSRGEFRTNLEGLGAPFPPFSAYVIPWAELLAGAALLVGFAHKTASAVIILLMVGAVLYFHKGAYFAPKGMEYPLALISMSLLVFMAGPGSFAYKLDLKQNKPPSPH